VAAIVAAESPWLVEWFVVQGFHLWKQRIKMLLLGKVLLETMEGMEKKLTTSHDEISKWEARDGKTRVHNFKFM
jgi:hypothetical protein